MFLGHRKIAITIHVYKGANVLCRLDPRWLINAIGGCCEAIRVAFRNI